MEIEDLESVSKVLSFSELQTIFEKFIANGKAEVSPDLFVIGYSSLISYPAITLTKKFNSKELEAAQKCYDLMLEYGKSNLQEMARSEDEKTKLAANILIIPPTKRLLASCNEFYMLDYLIKAETESLSEDQIETYYGDEFAKQWLNIFNMGYHGETTELALDDNFKHMNNSSILIRKMKLSDENVTLMDVERIKPLFKQYYHNTSSGSSGSGCVVFILIAGALGGLLASCI